MIDLRKPLEERIKKLLREIRKTGTYSEEVYSPDAIDFLTDGDYIEDISGPSITPKNPRYRVTDIGYMFLGERP